MKKLLLIIILSALLFSSCFIDDHSSSSAATFTYPTPDKVNSFLDTVHLAYPGITSIETVGYSVSGREIRALIISDNPGTLEGEPGVRLTGGIHGNEKIGMEILLRLISYLTSNYGSDTTVTEIVNSRYICIIPVLNPDGLASNSRYNSNGVDLNRNFDDAYNNWAASGTTNGSAAFSEAESKAIRDYSLTKDFAVSITYHAGSVLVNLPFDFGRESDGVYPAQYDLVKAYAKTYTRAGSFLSNPDLYVDPYMDEGTINGGDWYVITGSLQDWSYTVTKCLDLTIEVADSSPGTEDEVQQVFLYNRDSILAYIGRAGEGTFDGLVYSK